MSEVYIVFVQYPDEETEVHSVWSTDELATKQRNGLMARSHRPEAAWISKFEVDRPS